MPSKGITIVLLALSCYFIIYNQPISARIFDQCEAVKELVNAGIQRTFISNFVCVMQSMSKFNTSLKTGPGHKASFSYGIFQISSDEWCNAWRPGGYCNMTCTDFLDDDIKNDIVCAETIWTMRGFKHWKGWVKDCKNKKLPDVSRCIELMDFEEDEILRDMMREMSSISRINEWDLYGNNAHILRLNYSQFVEITNSLF